MNNEIWGGGAGAGGGGVWRPGKFVVEWPDLQYLRGAICKIAVFPKSRDFGRVLSIICEQFD
jgi:hypothetical protein